MLTVSAILSFSGLVGCREEPRAEVISLEQREPAGPRSRLPAGDVVRIAVGGMITPREGFAYYRRLLDYLGEKLSRPVEFVDRDDYAEINALLELGRVDIAFVCGGPYVDAHDAFGLELLVAPQAYGESVYYSYFIVHKDSPIERLEQLRGKTFAFTDPLSNTGKLVPTYLLAGKFNETPETFFKRYVYSKAHDRSIESVAQGIVDGAAVDSLVWEYVNRNHPELTSKTRVITRSEPHGIPPVVVRPGLDPEFQQRVRAIFLRAHEDTQGKAILKGMMIDRFVPITDSAYDSIRKMKMHLQTRAPQMRIP